MKILSNIEDNEDIVSKEYVDTNTPTKINTVSLQGGGVNNTLPYLGKVDLRNKLRPVDLQKGALTCAFGSKGGIDNGTNNNVYVDILGLKTWDDVSGGGVNLLFATKNEQGLYHYRGAYNGETWTDRKQIAYKDDKIQDGRVIWGDVPRQDGDLAPSTMGCLDEFGHNRLAYLPADCISFAFSRDGGLTWYDYTTENGANMTPTLAQKIQFMTYENTWMYAGGRFNNSSTTVSDERLRIRLRAWKNTTTPSIYMQVQQFIFNTTSQGSGNNTLKIRHRTIQKWLDNDETAWVNDGTYTVKGWSGWNSIPYRHRFGGSVSQKAQEGEIEFEFYQTTVDSSKRNMQVGAIRAISSNFWTSPSELASTGRLYKLDENKNAIFPNHIYFNDSFSLNLYPNSSSSTYRHIGSSDNQWKDLHLSDGIYHNGNKLTLPSTAGTLALTSDITNSHCVEQSSTAPTNTDIVLWIEDSDIDGSGGGGGTSIEVIDSLISTSTTNALSANQGRVLNGKITTIESDYLTSTNIKDNLTTDSATDALSAKQGKLLDTRVSALEGDNLDSRLDTLEGQNLDSRLDTIEAKNLVESTNISKIVMVTEYPSTPDPDTLYVKVASL